MIVTCDCPQHNQLCDQRPSLVWHSGCRRSGPQNTDGGPRPGRVQITPSSVYARLCTDRCSEPAQRACKLLLDHAGRIPFQGGTDFWGQFNECYLKADTIL